MILKIIKGLIFGGVSHASVWDRLANYGISLQKSGNPTEENVIRDFLNQIEDSNLGSNDIRTLLKTTFRDAGKTSTREQLGFWELSNVIRNINSADVVRDYREAKDALGGITLSTDQLIKYQEDKKREGQIKSYGEDYTKAFNLAEQSVAGQQFGVASTPEQEAAMSNLRDRYGSVDLRRSEALVGQQGAEATAQRGLMGSLAAAGVQGGAAGAALTDMSQANIRARRGIESTVRQEKDKLAGDLYGAEMDRTKRLDEIAKRRREAIVSVTMGALGSKDEKTTTPTTPKPKK